MLRIVIFMILAVLITVACEKNSQLSFVQDKTDNYLFFRNSDSTRLVVKINGKNKLTWFGEIDNDDNKNGYYFEYYDNGQLYRKSFYSNGLMNGEERVYNEKGWLQWAFNYVDDIRNGHMYEYWENGDLKQHKIYNNGEMMYASIYHEGEKKIDSIYPFTVKESKNKEDYIGIFKFPIPFPGEMEIYLRDSLDFSTKFIDKQTFRVKINNEKDLKVFDMRFIYHPNENDTLIFSEYFYEHTVGDRSIDKIKLVGSK